MLLRHTHQPVEQDAQLVRHGVRAFGGDVFGGAVQFKRGFGDASCQRYAIRHSQQLRRYTAAHLLFSFTHRSYSITQRRWGL